MGLSILRVSCILSWTYYTLSLPSLYFFIIFKQKLFYSLFFKIIFIEIKALTSETPGKIPELKFPSWKEQFLVIDWVQDFTGNQMAGIITNTIKNDWMSGAAESWLMGLVRQTWGKEQTGTHHKILSVIDIHRPSLVTKFKKRKDFWFCHLFPPLNISHLEPNIEIKVSSFQWEWFTWESLETINVDSIWWKWTLVHSEWAIA